MPAQLIVTLLALLTPQPVLACSCARISYPTLERCADAERVFLGTIGEHRWPLRPELLFEPAHMVVEVDRVWRGEVPERVVAHSSIGGGSGGLDTRPGDPILVCDSGGELWLHMCSPPLFNEHALDVAAQLGPSHRPSPGGERLYQARLLLRSLLWSSPLLILGLAAQLGRRSRRWGVANTGKRLRLLRIALCVVAIVLMSRVLTVDAIRNRWVLELFLPLVLASGLGAVFAFIAARAPSLFGGKWRATLTVLGLTMLGLAVGNARPHVPIDHPNARACSIARAEAALSTLTIDELDHQGAERALERVPRSCTDWGLGRYGLLHEYRAMSYGACLSFTEHNGGLWWVCRNDRGTRTLYGWEGPR